jgi:hypothetical protein
MVHRIAGALAVLLLSAGFALADEFFALITKVEGDRVTFHRVKKMEKGDEMTLPATDAKVTTGGKFSKETKKVEGAENLPQGLKNDRFRNIGEKGMFARITTDEDNKKITAIHLVTFKKKQ